MAFSKHVSRPENPNFQNNMTFPGFNEHIKSIKDQTIHLGASAQCSLWLPTLCLSMNTKELKRFNYHNSRQKPQQPVTVTFQQLMLHSLHDSPLLFTFSYPQAPRQSFQLSLESISRPLSGTSCGIKLLLVSLRLSIQVYYFFFF